MSINPKDLDPVQLKIELNFLKNRLAEAETHLTRLQEHQYKKESLLYPHDLTVGNYVEATEAERGEIRSIFTRKNGTEMAVLERSGYLHIVRLSTLRKTIR